MNQPTWLHAHGGKPDEPLYKNPLALELFESLEATYQTFVRRHAGEFTFADVVGPLHAFMGHVFGSLYQFPPWHISQDMSWERFREATLKTFADYLDKSQGRGRLKTEMTDEDRAWVAARERKEA